MAAKSKTKEPEDDPYPPRRTPFLVGHRAAEARLLRAYRRGRLHHAHLFTGPPGVGKATLAFRLTRFLAAYPDHRSGVVQAAETLDVDAADPAFSQVASGGHPDVMTVTSGADGKQGISVDVMRRATGFLQQTPALGGWRVLIVDPAEDMAAASANALLKSLEEPGARTLIILVSHDPGALLPTIRSRCLTTRFDALSRGDVARVAARLSPDDEASPARLDAAHGRPGRYLRITKAELEIEERFRALVSGLPRLSAERVHGFADGLNKRDAFRAFMPVWRDWLAGSVRRTAVERTAAEKAETPYSLLPGRLEDWAALWNKTEEAAALADEYNLERSQTVRDALLTAARIAKGPAPSDRGPR